jgi:hypothetical protein
MMYVTLPKLNSKTQVSNMCSLPTPMVGLGMMGAVGMVFGGGRNVLQGISYQ